MTLSNPFYLKDLEQYLFLMDELNHNLMSPKRRSTLETCKEALEIILSIYDIDHR